MSLLFSEQHLFVEVTLIKLLNWNENILREYSEFLSLSASPQHIRWV